MVEALPPRSEAASLSVVGELASESASSKEAASTSPEGEAASRGGGVVAARVE